MPRLPLLSCPLWSEWLVPADGAVALVRLLRLNGSRMSFRISQGSDFQTLSLISNTSGRFPRFRRDTFMGARVRVCLILEFGQRAHVYPLWSSVLPQLQLEVMPALGSMPMTNFSRSKI